VKPGRLSEAPTLRDGFLKHLQVEIAFVYSTGFQPKQFTENYMAQAQRKDDEAQTSFSNRPVDTARHGNVEIAIWRNEGTKGEFYSASIPTIRYKDGEEWKEGSNFGRHDLLDLAEAAREAALKLRDLQRSKGQNQSR
jgi:hypothetical protein